MPSAVIFEPSFPKSKRPIQRKPKGWNDATIKRIAAPARGQEDHWDSAKGGEGWVRGLGLRVTKHGTKTWIVACRILGGNQGRYKIGDASVMGLEDARAEAKRWLAWVNLGKDPRREIEDEKAATILAEQRRQHDSLRAVAEEFKKRHLSQIRTGEETWAMLDRLLLKPMGDRAVASITLRELAREVNRVHDAGSPYTANRLVAFTKKMFGWMVEQGYLDASPADHLTKPLKNEVKRERVLTDAEIKALWRATAEKGAYNSLVRFLLLTCARRGEAAQGRPCDVVDGVWSIPAGNSKNGMAHALPLPALALRVLKDRPKIGDEFLFSNVGDIPVNGWSKAKANLDADMLKELRKEDPKAKLTDWVLHDLRRTGATGMAALGVQPHIIEAALNHLSGFRGGVAGVYNRNSYAPEIKDALQRWADHVERITA